MPLEMMRVAHGPSGRSGTRLERAVQRRAAGPSTGLVERDTSACGAPARGGALPDDDAAGETTTAPDHWIRRGHSGGAGRVEERAACIDVGVASPLLPEERVHVLLRVERHQVVDSFADADVADRQPEIVRDGYRDSALCGPSSFVSTIR